MRTQKKTAMEYTQKEMRMVFKHLTTKKPIKHNGKVSWMKWGTEGHKESRK